MYITATRAFVPPHVPILIASVAVPLVGYLAMEWAFPQTTGGYITALVTASLN